MSFVELPSDWTPEPKHWRNLHDGRKLIHPGCLSRFSGIASELERLVESRSDLSGQRLHLSFGRRTHLHGRLRHGEKPAGLWYGMGASWIGYCGFMPIKMRPHLHVVETVSEAVLRISSKDELDQFHEEYAIAPQTEYERPSPDWGRVSERWAGIELDMDPGEISSKSSWEEYRSGPEWARRFSVASGCVWHRRGVFSVRRIASYDFRSNRFVDAPQFRRNAR